MQLEQSLEMYQSMQEAQRQRVYVVGDLESLSASALYTGEKIFLPNGKCVDGNSINGYEGSLTSVFPKSIGTFSDFESASSLNLGPGIAREISEAGKIIERIRKDSDLPSHLNYEYLVPGKKTASGKQKWINLANIHIDLEG